MAPDGSEVRILAASSRGSMAQFTLPPGAVSTPVAHRSVEEVWLVMSGTGRMWRKLGADEEIVGLHPGISIAIPVGASFQFRNDGAEPLHCVGVTMPPWPGMDEAYEVAGVW
jgi:mannose-6-phosphate isomerase-like protein (cupin superfamily)